jgi:hypothetical protein
MLLLTTSQQLPRATTSEQLLRAEKNVNSLLTAMQRNRGDKVNPAAQIPRCAPKPVWKNHTDELSLFSGFSTA